MYFALMHVSIAVAVCFALILLFVGPAARLRPKVREGLWIAWHMLVLAIFSIVVLLVIETSKTSMVLYAVAMLAALCVGLWLRQRYHARQVLR
jgi:hypothetical protein